MEALKGASGQISRRTLSLQPRGDDTATTLMAGYMAFRAERCDMQAFTLTVCLSHTHLHTHTHSYTPHTPQGLPLITADLCTFRLWNDSKADLRTAYHTFPSYLIASSPPSLSLSDSLHHLSVRPSFPPCGDIGVCLLFLHHCQSVVQFVHKKAHAFNLFITSVI